MSLSGTLTPAAKPPVEAGRASIASQVDEPASPLDDGYPGPLPRSAASATVIATIAVIGALWWGQRFLVPVAAGLMLAMLVAPVVAGLRHLLRSQMLAVLLSLVLFLALAALASMAFGGKLLRMVDRSPEIIRMVAERITPTETDDDSVLKRSRDALQELDRAAQGVANGAPPPKPTRQKLIPAAPAHTLTETVTLWLRDTALNGSSILMKFAGDLTIIVFVAFFVLSGGSPLAGRFIDLWGGRSQSRTRACRALHECSRQIRIYVGVLLVTNVLIGCAVWAGFAWGEIPDAAMWGVTAAVLHVVPYVGMGILTAFGAAEAFLAHGTAGAAIGTAVYLVVVSTLIGTAVAAWLQSRAARMNAAAVFIGLVFWGALWGVWGLFLGPGLIVVMKVVAEHSRSATRLARLMEG